MFIYQPPCDFHLSSSHVGAYRVAQK